MSCFTVWTQMELVHSYSEGSTYELNKRIIERYQQIKQELINIIYDNSNATQKKLKDNFVLQIRIF